MHEEPSEYDGRQVIVVVLDRKERHEVPGYFDLWPLAAELLGFGPSFGDRDAGCVKVTVEGLVGSRRRRGFPEGESALEQ